MRIGVKPLFTILLVFLSFTQSPIISQENAITSYNRGVMLLERGNYFEGIQQFQNSLRFNPQYAQALFGMARAYFYLEEYDESFLQITNALSLNPRSIDYQNFQARILLALGRVDEASNIFADILTRSPFNKDALLGRAELLLSLGDLSAAQQSFLSTLSIHPQDRRTLLALGILYQEQGNFMEAQRYFERSLEYHSENEDVQLSVAEFYFYQGDFLRAQEHISLTLELNPDKVDGLFLQTNVYIQTRQLTRALDSLDRAIQLFPESDLYWYTRGYIQYHLQRIPESLISLQRALRYNPENEIARIFIETIAIDNLEFLDSARTNLAEYRLSQARQFKLQNRFDRAFFYVNRGLALSPMHENLRRERADLFLRTGRIAFYIEELHFLLDELGVRDRILEDQREVYDHLHLESLSQRRSIQQFDILPDYVSVPVYYQKSVSIHPNAVEFVGQQIVETLLGYPRFTMNPNPLTGNGRFRPPTLVSSLDQAFQDARQMGSDYFLVVDLIEYPRRFDTSAGLYLARTGRLVSEFSVSRTGNNRVMESVIRLAEEIETFIPHRGNIVQRTLNTGIINLGSEHGITVGDGLPILNRRDLTLTPDGSLYQITRQNQIGTFTVTAIDSLISEGRMESIGFFDSISLGDTVVMQGLADGDDVQETQGINLNNLYNRIRSLR